MNAGQTLFSQLMDCLPWSTFARIVARHGGDRWVQTFPCTEQYRAMAFAQLTFRESLRDIEACLSAQSEKLWHMGFRGPVRRSTLSDANEKRDWQIYAEFTKRLIVQARRLYVGESLLEDLDSTVYALELDYHRFMFVVVPLGAFPRDESGCENAHAAGPTGQYPEFHPHIGRKAARCTRARHVGAGSRRHLRDGSRIGRLRTAVPTAPSGRVLRHPRQIQPRRASGLFGGHRPLGRGDSRPNDRVGRPLHETELPGASPAGPLPGCRSRQDLGVPHQSDDLAHPHNLQALQMSLAGGAFL